MRSSADVITATFTGNASSHINTYDISNLQFAFADGAFANTAAATNVTNSSKNDLSIDFLTPTPNIFDGVTIDT